MGRWPLPTLVALVLVCLGCLQPGSALKNETGPRWPNGKCTVMEFRDAGFELGKLTKHLPIYPENVQIKYMSLDVLSLGEKYEIRSQIYPPEDDEN